MAKRNLKLDEFFAMSRSEQNIRYKELSSEEKFAARLQDVSTKEVFIPCNYWIHYHGFAKCEAYPEGIPGEVMDSIIENEQFQCAEKIHYEYSGRKWNVNETWKIGG